MVPDLYLKVSPAPRGKVNYGGARIEVGRPVTFLYCANAEDDGGGFELEWQ